MDIISLLITIAGIIIILALYLLGQISRNKMPQERDIASIPNIVDDNGEKFTSVLDDIPATDGSTPKPIPQQSTFEESNSGQESEETNSSNIEETSSTSEKKQNILFISAKDKNGLDGNIIDKVLKKNGLKFGDMDIYHYMLKNNDSETFGLFRVANGVEPWTLGPQDLNGKWLPGLSLFLVTPTQIDDKKAITLFVDTAKAIAEQLNGELKNQQQQVFTKKDEDEFLNSLE